MLRFLAFLLFLIVAVILLLCFIGSHYKNHYKLSFVFGKKGSGKTTYLTKKAIQFSRKGWYVYSNVELFNAFKLDTDWLGKYDFPEHSVILIDEVSMIWSNRDFKDFAKNKKHIEQFFRLQRHDKIYVILASQSFDVDKKIRDLADEMYLLKNAFNCITVAKKINKYQDVHNTSDNDKDNQSGLVEMYRFAPFWEWEFTFNPRYFRFFNSFEKIPKPKVTSEKYQFEDFENMIYMSQFKNWIKVITKDYYKLFKYNRHLDSLSFKFKDSDLINYLNLY